MKQEMLDFSNVESATGGYLAPGIYYVKPTEVELEEGQEGKSSAIKVTFEAINEPYKGQAVEAKFFLTQKALPRLQYLHEKYFGVKLEQKAISFQQLADYLSKKMLAKPKTVLLSVSGREGKDGKVYGDLPYSDFIIDDVANPDVAESAYDEDSAAYRKSVRKYTNGAPMSSAAVLSNGTLTEKEPWDVD